MVLLRSRQLRAARLPRAPLAADLFLLVSEAVPRDIIP